VRTEVYEGPLDVLLNLIEKRKLLINDISLAAVADDFISYVNNHREFPISQASQFIIVASTLLLIKSKSLLPVLELTEEEEQSVEELENRLTLYQKYRDLSRHVTGRFGVHILFGRSTSKQREPYFSPDDTMTVEALHTAVSSVLIHLPTKRERLAQATVEKVISLEVMIDRLTSRIQNAMKLSFKDFAKRADSDATPREVKVHLVVSFLAMLELVKQGAIRVEQEAQFSDIIMETDSVSVPRYA
jgi:segregation and condensation protein A